MAKEFAKVNVEHVATALQHDVVIVAVAYAQDVGGHTAACTGVDEVLYCLQKNNGTASSLLQRQDERLNKL